MSDKKIKIVKRAERVVRPPRKKKGRAATSNTARDMVNTVKNWVNEFQQKQRHETAEAIDNLIRARDQQPTEA